MKPLKTIAFITCAWKRIDILKIYLEAIIRFAEDAPSNYASFICVCTSPEDNTEGLHELLTENSTIIISAPNQPLGYKWNCLVEAVQKELNPDYYMIMGSDDLFTMDAWDSYETAIENNYDYCGHNSIQFYNTQTGECVKWKSFHKMVGCGRLLSRKVIEQCHPLWNDDIDRALDADSDAKIQQHFKPVVFLDEYAMIDLKSVTNLNEFNRFKRKIHNPKTGGYFSPSSGDIESLLTATEQQLIHELKTTSGKDSDRNQSAESL